ncbi:MAG TPA: glutamine amidotransferase, partial [Candidatus Saccharimonadales bacterium]|nr:glutamine amidotransferase [Candidatus Saccharimonadales bacterium]
EEVKGIGIFDAETIGGDKRLIGNIAFETDLGTIYGFENHSGRTYLHGSQKPFGKVIRGNGNNGEDKTEGAQTNNVIGSYSHGPVLPANPALADWMIQTAATNAYGEYWPEEIDDSVANQVRAAAQKRKY